MDKIDSSLIRTVLNGVKPSIHKSDSNRCKGNKYITDGKYMFITDKMVSTKARIEKLQNWISKGQSDYLDAFKDRSPRTVTHETCDNLFYGNVEKATEPVSLLPKVFLNYYSAAKHTVCAQLSSESDPKYITLVDVKYLALCWSHLKFDSAKIDPETHNNAVVLYRDNEPVGLLMPVKRKEDD